MNDKKTLRGELIIEEIELSFDKKEEADVINNYVNNTLGLVSELNQVPGGYILSVHDITESQLNKLRKHCSIENFTNKTINLINSTRDAVTGAIDIAAYRVAAPCAQAAIKASGGVVKVIAKTTIATAATAVGTTFESARKVKEELSTDHEVVRAKKEFSNFISSAKNLFGFNKNKEIKSNLDQDFIKIVNRQAS